jgi:hypothetical protein
LMGIGDRDERLTQVGSVREVIAERMGMGRT